MFKTYTIFYVNTLWIPYKSLHLAYVRFVKKKEIAKNGYLDSDSESVTILNELNKKNVCLYVDTEDALTS